MNDGMDPATRKDCRANRFPLEGRIVCIADSMDAMFSKRPYKGKMPPEKVKEELQKNRGLQFDPTMVDAVLEHWEEIADMYHAEAGG